MLVIRMRQQGSVKKRRFRIVVIDQRAPRNGAYIESLGWYDPQAKGEKCKIYTDRFDHWKKLGATITGSAEYVYKNAKKIGTEAIKIAEEK